MTEMQKRMQELISKEALDRAFDARFPKEMQEKLRAAKVAVAGLGGLGSNIAVMLARSGIGKLLLVDFDVVDVTNLNRQMYFIPQLGKPKTEALTGCWFRLIPYTEYETVCIKVTPENVKELFSEYQSYVRHLTGRTRKQCWYGASHPVSEDDSRIEKRNGRISDTNEIRTQQMMQRLYVCRDQEHGGQ